MGKNKDKEMDNKGDKIIKEVAGGELKIKNMQNKASAVSVLSWGLKWALFLLERTER